MTESEREKEGEERSRKREREREHLRERERGNEGEGERASEREREREREATRQMPCKSIFESERMSARITDLRRAGNNKQDINLQTFFRNPVLYNAYLRWHILSHLFNDIKETLLRIALPTD
jgi:hypothetical protein